MQAYNRFDDDRDERLLNPSCSISRMEQEEIGLVRRSSYVPATTETQSMRRYQIPTPPTQVIELPARAEGERIIREETDPLRRALAVAISSSLWGILCVFAGMVIIWASDTDSGVILVTVLLAVVVTGRMFLKFDRQAHEYSPAGVDRQKNAQLHRERMYELRRRFELHEKMIDKLLGQEENE
jgi:hypothetical protein